MRNLTRGEIVVMERRGCRAESWERIRVADEFTPGDSFRRVYFSGDVELGVYVGEVGIGEGIFLPAGVTTAKLHNVKIGNNCRIYASTLANVDVGDDVLMEHVAALSCEGKGGFGNGIRAHVLTEDGARSVPVWRHLSAQMAHLLCHYKDAPLGVALERLVEKDVALLTGGRSRVGRGCKLQRTGRLRNIWIGDGVAAEGVGDLSDCYLEGGRRPARLRNGVSAEGCVFLASSRVENGVRLERSLVGEGAVLEQSLYARHCLFFANSFFKLGEAVCVMAGPFAESHHRATLALTCQCSFSTFGSGANASNHHFKLGPRHGGILRRGTRCGSGSYLFWPGDVGAFSTVVGEHAEHLETADFPFSLLLSTGTASVLVPGVHLFGIGIFRDGVKWRQRDRRDGVEGPLDLVNISVLSPYVMQSIERGIAMLRRSEGMEGDLRHGGAVIPAHRIKPALHLYESGLVFYVGECLLRHLSGVGGGEITAAGLARALADAVGDGVGYTGGRWRDWGGMLLSGRDADAFSADVTNGVLSTWREVRNRLGEIHAAYEEREFEWAVWRWRRSYGEPTEDAVVDFIRKWRKAVEFRFECMLKDAGKEFTRELAYGYGVEENALECFRRIRGKVTNEPIIRDAEQERDRLLAMAERIGK